MNKRLKDNISSRYDTSLQEITFRTYGRSRITIWQFLITLLEEAATSGIQGNDGLRWSLEMEKDSWLIREEEEEEEEEEEDNDNNVD
jgi:hypothetical protein